MYKNILYLTLKLTALAAVIAFEASANTDSGFYIIAALAFCCLFLIDFLINRMCSKKLLKVICAPIGIAGCMLCGATAYFPLLLMLVFEFIDLMEADRYFYHISASAALLLAFIFSPDYTAIISALIIIILGTLSRIIIGKLVHYKELSEEQRQTISSQSEKISGLKTYSKTLRDTVAMEERSRFSARIHDKLGHGISGSIILLEGAKLNVKTNPDQAEKCLGTAIENLRGSVDSIREALREERPKRHIAGIAEFKEMLERFSSPMKSKPTFPQTATLTKSLPRYGAVLRKT